LEDEDFESARIESSTTVKIEKFVDAGSIDPIYFDASYYMAPDGAGGDDVYVVLRDAIASTGKVALSRVVIARREHPIAIMPMGKGLRGGSRYLLPRPDHRRGDLVSSYQEYVWNLQRSVRQHEGFSSSSAP